MTSLQSRLAEGASSGDPVVAYGCPVTAAPQPWPVHQIEGNYRLRPNG